ncbi:hypothetical protein BC829DRAFT_393503 [Chytridium lagenaria]|nr:hypothetical protein BC829DRAFT_393503 [Chytridium lagenaria]
MADDPFYSVKQYLNQTSSLNQLYDKWLRLQDSQKAPQPTRFRIDVREISSRKEFVEMKSAVNNPGSRPAMAKSHSGMTASPDTRKKEKTDRDALFAGKVKVDAYGRTEEEHRMSNQKFIERERGQQDAQLDEVMDTVGNLKEGLDDQTRLLDDLETNVDTTKGKLDMGMKRLKEFVNANSGTFNPSFFTQNNQWTICGLITALIILLFLVLYL